MRLLEFLPEGQAGKVQVDKAFADLAKVHSEYAEALQFTPADLAKRGREKLDPATVAAAWKKAGDAPSPEALDALVADVRGMIAHVGDTSNLILSYNFV